MKIGDKVKYVNPMEDDELLVLDANYIIVHIEYVNDNYSTIRQIGVINGYGNLIKRYAFRFKLLREIRKEKLLKIKDYNQLL